MSLTSLSVNGRQTLVDVHIVGNHTIEGTINGLPVVLYRIGEHWYPKDSDGNADSIQVLADVPEAVFLAIRDRLDADTSLTWDAVVTQALALWELQHGAGANSAVGGVYLNSLFPSRMAA
jgi:hypothetical protein